MKRCSKCNEEKALDLFGPDRRSKDGRRGVCRKCRNAYLRDWEKQNPVKAKARYARYRKTDLRKASVKRYESANKKKKAERMKDAYWSDPEASRQKRRDSYRKNLPRSRELSARRARIYYRSNPSKFKARGRYNARVMNDEYIRMLLCSHKSGLRADVIPAPLIEAKRVQLQIHRLLKEISK